MYSEELIWQWFWILYFIRGDGENWVVCLGEGTWGEDYNTFQIINVEEEIYLPFRYASNIFAYFNF